MPHDHDIQELLLRTKLDTILLIVGTSTLLTFVKHFDVSFDISICLIGYTLFYVLAKRSKWRQLAVDCPTAVLILYSTYKASEILSQATKTHIIKEPGIAAIIFLILLSILVIAFKNKKVQLIFNKLYMTGRVFILIIVSDIFVLLFILSEMFDVSYSIEYGNIYKSLFIAAGAYFIINVALIWLIIQTVRQNKKIKILSDYSDTMADMNVKLRKKDHDYSAHLSGILSILSEETEMKVAREKTGKYIQSIRDEYKKTQSNTVIAEDAFLAAYISYILSETKSKEIIFRYTIAKPISEYGFSENGLITVLSNLIMNAIDAVENLPKQERKISLLFDYGRIVIANTVDCSFNESDISKFTAMGFSTKNKGRGVGLPIVVNVLKEKNMCFEQYVKNNTFFSEIFYE